ASAARGIRAGGIGAYTATATTPRGAAATRRRVVRERAATTPGQARATTSARRVGTSATAPTATAAATAGRRLGRRAGPTHRAVVLPIPIYPIGNLVVYRDMVHLADGERDGLERAPMIRREAYAGVVGQTEMIRILRVDPDVVIVA